MTKLPYNQTANLAKGLHSSIYLDLKICHQLLYVIHHFDISNDVLSSFSAPLRRKSAEVFSLVVK